MFLCTDKNDPRIKYWGDITRNLETGDLSTSSIEINRSKLVGAFMPFKNCKALAMGAYFSFWNSLPKNYPCALIGIDTGSTDGTYELMQNLGPVYSNRDPGFQYDVTGIDCRDSVPNVGIELLLGKWNKDKDRFEKEDDFAYVLWIHTDMDFQTFDWLNKMIERYESDPKMGILSPRTRPEKHNDVPFRENAAPTMISTKILKEFYRNYGHFADPAIAWPVAFDDWDVGFRLAEMGYKQLVDPDIVVLHPTGGTRNDLARQDPLWNLLYQNNRAYYEQKHGTHKTPFFAHNNWGIEDGFKLRNGKVFYFKDFEYERKD